MDILIVDDSAVMVTKTREILRELPIVNDIFSASSLDETLDTLKNRIPHVAIIDIQLNGGSGFDVLRHLKKSYPALKVIMYSNTASEIYRTRSMTLGAEYFIDKSHQFEEIPGLIRGLKQGQDSGL